MTTESDIADIVFTNLKDIFTDINTNNVVHLITRVMGEVESCKSFDRAEIATVVVGRLINTINDSGTRNLVKSAVDTLLPAIMENVCRVARGHSQVNLSVSRIATICASVKSCFGLQ